MTLVTGSSGPVIHHASCRVTENKKREDKKRKRSEEDKAKAEAKEVTAKTSDDKPATKKAKPSETKEAAGTATDAPVADEDTQEAVAATEVRHTNLLNTCLGMQSKTHAQKSLSTD